jgi:hypothetical protein
MKLTFSGNARICNVVSRLAAAGIVGLVSSGCAFYPAEQVHGTVRYHGEPVRGGSIYLLPSSGIPDSWAAGVIESDGTFVVKPTRGDAPLPSGRYDVFFSRPVRQRRSYQGRHEEEEAEKLENTVPAPPTNEIPDKYLDVNHPVFSIDVSDRPLLVNITLRD